VGAFVIMHLALWMCLRLGPFALTMISAWMLFLPSEFWDAVTRRRRSSVRHPYPLPAGFESQHWIRHPVVQCFGLFCTVYVILWDLRGAKIGRSDQWFPQWANPIGYVLNLQQYWTMFAPRPPTDDGWVIMEAVLANGTHVDLLRGGRPVSYEKPALISAEFRNSKWQKAILNLWSTPYQHIRPSFGNYIAFDWNGSHASSEQIKGWTFWYMREDTPSQGALTKHQRILLLKAGRM